MSQFSVCPDPSMFSDTEGWEYDEPEPDEPAELPAPWDETAEGDMRYDIAEEQRLFAVPELAIPSLHCIGVRNTNGQDNGLEPPVEQAQGEPNDEWNSAI